jgi:endonuclease I
MRALRLIIRNSLITASGALLGWSLAAQAQDTSPPPSYYASLASSGSLPAGDNLRRALHDLIDGHTVISYNDLPELFEIIDRDPNNPSNVILLYSGYSVSGTSTSWNREHTWPRSYGADSGPAYSDAHHLFPADVDANSDRSNYGFANLSSGTGLRDAPQSIYDSSLRMVEPRDADKGRIARALLYMEVRYDGSDSRGDFTLNNFLSANDERHGTLSALLEWNRAFPPDERERRRNHFIATGATTRVGFRRQGNRNPFVDYPGLADLIYSPTAPLDWSRWQFQQFSLPEISDGTGAELADPDSDGLTNLMEFAIQTDPADPVVPAMFTVTTSGGADYITFNRVIDPAASFLSYTVEATANPDVPSSWAPLVYDEDLDLLIDNRGDYDLVSLYYVPADNTPLFYRLVVTRDVPGATEIRTTFPYDTTRYTLSVSTTPGGTVNLVSEGFIAPTAMEVVATPAPGYLFSNWSGAIQSTANPLTILIDGTYSLLATFSPDLRDSDGDGLNNYEELVLFGTNPALADSSGDGLIDGALASAGYDPAVNYGALRTVLEQSLQYLRPGTLVIDSNQNGTISLQFDIERSTNLETWTINPADRVEKVLQRDQSVEFFRLAPAPENDPSH